MSVLKLTNKNFKEEVLHSDKPVLADFWAEWCGSCRALAPIIDELAEEFDGAVKIGKVNIDEETLLPVYYGVQSIPTLILFDNGRSIKRVVGHHTKNEIKRALGLD